MTNFEKALHKKLYRGDCPSAEILHDYYWHVLSSAQIMRVTKHMRFCPDCSAEYAQLAAFLSPIYDSTPAKASWLSVVIAQITSFVAEDPSPTLALRGSPAQQTLMFNLDDNQVLFVNTWQEHQEQFGMSCSIIPFTSTMLEGSVQLTAADDAGIKFANITVDGEFMFEKLKAGIYHLILPLRKKLVFIPPIKLVR